MIYTAYKRVIAETEASAQIGLREARKHDFWQHYSRRGSGYWSGCSSGDWSGYRLGINSCNAVCKHNRKNRVTFIQMLFLILSF